MEDVAPQRCGVGADGVYEGYERLIERVNTWLRDETDVTVVNLQSILVQNDNSIGQFTRCSVKVISPVLLQIRCHGNVPRGIGKNWSGLTTFTQIPSIW